MSIVLTTLSHEESVQLRHRQQILDTKRHHKYLMCQLLRERYYHRDEQKQTEHHRNFRRLMQEFIRSDEIYENRFIHTELCYQFELYTPEQELTFHDDQLNQRNLRQNLVRT